MYWLLRQLKPRAERRGSYACSPVRYMYSVSLDLGNGGHEQSHYVSAVPGRPKEMPEAVLSLMKQCGLLGRDWAHARQTVPTVMLVLVC